MIMPVITANGLSVIGQARNTVAKLELLYAVSTMSEPLFITPEGTDRLIGLALDGLASPHTRRAYQAALDEFLTWSQGQQPSELCKALVNRYKAMLFEKELAPATINLRSEEHTSELQSPCNLVC